MRKEYYTWRLQGVSNPKNWHCTSGGVRDVRFVIKLFKKKCTIYKRLILDIDNIIA